MDKEFKITSKNKTLLCLLGLILSTQIQWIIPIAEFFNGIGFLFSIGFGWYAKEAAIEEEDAKCKKKKKISR